VNVIVPLQRKLGCEALSTGRELALKDSLDEQALDMVIIVRRMTFILLAAALDLVILTNAVLEILTAESAAAGRGLFLIFFS
jgi:hypothetical protein